MDAGQKNLAIPQFCWCPTMPRLSVLHNWSPCQPHAVEVWNDQLARNVNDDLDGLR
jgi:hypothetical protein